MTFLEWYAALQAEVRLWTRAGVESVDPGKHRTTRAGKGFRLRHHAEYRPGDDRRLIDWKVSLKVGDVLVKRFAHEGRLDVVAACDVSPSMVFGTDEAKWDVMLRILGVLGLATLEQRDSFGVILFSDRVEREVRVAHGRTQMLRLLQELWEAPKPAPGRAQTRLIPALERIAMKPPALVFLVSDFQSAESWTEMYEAVSVKHDLVPILVRDSGEARLPCLGVIAVRDLESGEDFALDTASPAWRARFEARVRTAELARIELFERMGGDYLVASRETNFVGELLGLFHRRKLR